MTHAMTVEELFAQSGGGAPIFFNKDSRIGDLVEGEVVEAKAREARDFENPSVIKTWDDGSPQWQLVVTLQTTMRDRSIEDDDGKRRVFLRWYGSDKKATEDAVSKAGDPFVKIGAWMRVTFAGYGEAANARLSPPKLYDVQYRAASSVETLMTKPAPSSSPQGVSYSQGGIVTGTASSAPPADYQPNIPEQRSAVSDARQTQQSAAASGDERREAITKVRKLVQGGFGADEIAGMLPALTREAIEAIIAVS